MGSSTVFSLLAKRLEGKVALITGGASGLGEATARLFSLHGAKVIIADIQDDLGHSLSSELGNSSTFIHCDVTSESDISHTVNSTISRHGKLDIMYNNAGIGHPPKPLVDSDESVFDKIFQVNVKGVFLGTKHAARVMIPARQGSIISTASVLSVVGGTGVHAYVSSKHAVVGLMKNAAVELGKYGIRVNCVSPYTVATPILTKNLGMKAEVLEEYFAEKGNLKGKVLKAEDVAEAVVYLAGDESKYVSGLNLLVDGGYNIVDLS